jgi:protein gp37
MVHAKTFLEKVGHPPNIDWVIVGSESGASARPMKREWVVSIQRQCAYRGIPFFFKQWGGIHKSKTGRLLDGRTYDEMPVHHGRSLALVPAD